MAAPPITILLIEDNPPDARLIEIMLGKAKGATFEMERVDRLSAGLARLADGGIQVILLDLGLPDSQGLDTFRCVRELAPAVPIVVLTGLDDEEVGLEAVRNGAQNYLVKGQASGDLLARTIRYAIERRRFEEIKKRQETLLRTNEELRELDRMKSAFIEVTSHELLTPLTALAGMLTYLGDQLPSGERKLAQAWQVADHAAKRLERLIMRTLEIAHSGEYGKRLVVVPTLVEDLVARVWKDVAPFMDLRGQTLETHIPEGMAPVLMDPDKIEDVLVNLLMNAIKFTPDGGQIGIEARLCDPDMLEVSVSDTGIGISPDDEPHIFDELFTSFDTLHHSSGEYEFGKRGLGLGLAIAKRFVEMHGGAIRVESEPGEGSTFTLTVPRTRER
ncbi:hybrid sensor histidine kinase/response regulator [bacterium]|nr:hybrid sensor histidine kinase/response regulator [bacterium]